MVDRLFGVAAIALAILSFQSSAADARTVGDRLGPSIANPSSTGYGVHALLQSDDGVTYVGDGDVTPTAVPPPPPAALSATALVMQIPKVPGSSTVSGYAGSIDLLTFAFGVTNPISNTGGGAGKAIPGAVTVEKSLDAATPYLEGAVFSGIPFSGISTVDLLVPAGQQWYRYASLSLTDLSVLSDSLGGVAGSLPLENAAFEAGTQTFCFYPQTATGAQGSSVCKTFDYARSTARGREPRSFR